MSQNILMRCLHLQQIKRDNLINEVNKLVSNPIEEPKKHAHAIHNLQRQWQLLDISGKSASKNQWNKFNDLSNKASGIMQRLF